MRSGTSAGIAISAVNHLGQRPVRHCDAIACSRRFDPFLRLTPGPNSISSKRACVRSDNSSLWLAAIALCVLVQVLLPG